MSDQHLSDSWYVFTYPTFSRRGRYPHTGKGMGTNRAGSLGQEKSSREILVRSYPNRALARMCGPPPTLKR